MTTWRVEWSADAEADLGQLLYEGVDPTELSTAIEGLERKLRSNPTDYGESRNLNERM